MNAARPPERHLDELPVEQCWQLLRQQSVGRVAFAEAEGGAPAVHPVNYAIDGDAIVFRTASELLLRVVGRGPISFEVDVIDHGHATGWSVLVRGGATVEEGDADDAPHPWVGTDRSSRFRLEATTVTGRWAHPGEHHGDGRGYL